VDFGNRLVHIPDSKTPDGEGDMPMTSAALNAFRAQFEKTRGCSEYLFPSPKPNVSKPYIKSLTKVWKATLQKAGGPYFPMYELRHGFRPG